MPTITINKTELEKYLGKVLPLEELKDRISMLGTDLESTENDLITVEIFPTRPDLLSLPGFARALSSFIGVKTVLREYSVKKSNYKIIIDPSVKELRPYTACAIVKNLKINDEKLTELIQIQEKLAITHGRDRKKSAYGIYPLDSITFPVHYIAKDPAKVMFKPLGFDHPIYAKDVPRLHPKGRDYAHLTAGWKKYPFFIDSADKVMCMLPFTNSEDTGKVDLQTKDVFIECTGNDFNNVLVALNIIVIALADMDGEIYSLELDYENKKVISPDLTPEKMKLDLKYINKLLGLSLTPEQAKILLEKMGYGYENGIVLIPAYRADILHQVDLAEDIAIAYGYENFKEEIPNVATIGEETPLEKFSRKIRECLVGLGLIEVKNYHLLTKEELTLKMNLSVLKPIGLKNALGEHNHLRNSLLPSLLKNLKENQHHEYPQNIFEIGRVFNLDKNTETGIGEKEHLAIMLCQEKTDFTAIKQILDALISALGLECKIKESKQDSFIPGRFGEILVEEKKIGIIGEISPQVITNWNFAVPATALELDLEGLFGLVKR